MAECSWWCGQQLACLLNTRFLHFSSSICITVCAFFRSLLAAFTSAPSCQGGGKGREGEGRDSGNTKRKGVRQRNTEQLKRGREGEGERGREGGEDYLH